MSHRKYGCTVHVGWVSILCHFPRWSLVALLAISLIRPCFALEPVPRKWTHLPMGTNFAGVGFAYTESDILIDPTILLEDVEMELQSWVAKYIRTFDLFGKSARIDLTQAYQEGEWTGLLDGVSVSTTRSGWSDTFMRLAVNLYGAPPLSGKDFAAYRSEMNVETIVGMALTVRLPTGEYMDDKLINLGKNRFTFRPQLGVIHTRGKWTAEVTGEVAFFTENDEFFNGNSLEQEPLYIIHGHLIHTFRPGFWVGASIGYDYGGENSVNGVDRDDTQQNIAWALSFAYPINRYSGISVKYIGTRTQQSTGLDSETLSAGLSIAW